MSDTLPDDAWTTSFLSSAPRPLLSSLQRRLQASTTHLNALTEVYKQRAAIEAAYADSLAKLARTAEQGGLNGKNGVEWDKSSGEGKLWDSVISDLSETSATHSTFSAMIRTDFETPLREMPSKIVAWRRISDQDSSLEKTLKEYEKTSAKLEKASSKAKSSKTDGLQSEIQQITQSLSSLSPMVYTTYQRLDEERLRGLKEVVVRWGTVKGDMAARDGERADAGVARLIGWETADEVLAVGRRLGGGGGGAGGGRTPSVAPTPPISANTTPRSIRRLSSVTANTANTNDFSPRPAPRQNGSSSNLTPTQSTAPTSFASGIKSMLGRKNSMAPSRGRSDSNATTNRDRDTFNAIGEDQTPTPPRVTSPPVSRPQVDEDGYSIAPADRHKNLWEEPNEVIPIPAAIPTLSQPPSAFNQTFTSSPTPSNDNLQGSASSQNFGQSQPKLNLAMTSAPIQESEEERQAALTKMQQTLAMPAQGPTRRQTVARGRRDVRNTVFGGVPDDGSGGYGGALGNAYGSGGPTGGREMLSEEPREMVPQMTGPIQPFGSVNGIDRPPVNRQLSQSSVSSNNPFDSPSLNAGPVTTSTIGTGLRANLTETINAIMKSGEITRIQITGEIHLSLRPTPHLNPNGPIHIRLTSFEALEKIAPNPAYLAQVPDKPGEYFLNGEVLAGASSKGPGSSGKGTLLFKYQVHVPLGKEIGAVPLVLEPVFLVQDGETRMILNYRVTDPNQTLTGVSISTIFGPGPSVSNVQAKPAGGVWSPSTRRMNWDLGVLKEGGKVVAKWSNAPGEKLGVQGVQATWGVQGVLGSGLGVEVVHGEGVGGFEEVRKGLVAGKYLAEPVFN